MSLEINDHEVSVVTIAMILLGIVLASASLGYSISETQTIDYKDAYMNGTSLCIPEGWARIHNPNSTGQDTSFIYHSEKEYCIKDGQQSTYKLIVNNQNGTITAVMPGNEGR